MALAICRWCRPTASSARPGSRERSATRLQKPGADTALRPAGGQGIQPTSRDQSASFLLGWRDEWATLFAAFDFIVSV
jgi:hypothetical protein